MGGARLRDALHGMTDIEQPPMHSNDSGISVPWSVREAVFGALIVAGANVLALVSITWVAGDTEGRVTRALVLFSMVILLGFDLLVVWYFAVKSHRATWRMLGFSPSSVRWGLLFPLLGLMLSIGLTAVYTLSMMALGWDSLVPTPLPAGVLGEGSSKLAAIAILGILGPFTEEVFFRGFLLAAMVHPFGALRAALVASAIFAASHGNVSILVPVFVSGLILSWLYLKTRSLIPSFTAHAAQNILALSVVA